MRNDNSMNMTGWRSSRWLLPIMAGILSGLLFAITLQTDINGSTHPYVTDVGELQNALPRWGTIHFSGYPFYSITGSFIVSVLRLVGVAPALGASLVSLIWGVATAVFVALLAEELGANRPAALIGALLFSLSTSMWIDSSLAEVHSLSMMFMAGILYFALRVDRTGRRRDLFGLTFFFSQGIFHGRAVLGLGPSVFLLVIPQWRLIKDNLLPVIGISLLAPVLYIYLPLREWMGADWTFGNTSTWQGFWRMFLNIKAGRFAEVPENPAGFAERLQVTLTVLNDDLPLLLTLLGLVNLLPLNRKGIRFWRTTLALLLAWLPFAIVPMIVYAGFIGDAILAIKLPVAMFAGIGISLLLTRLARWHRRSGQVALVAAALIAGFVAYRNYDEVVAITKDRSIEARIAIADQAANPAEPTVFSILWGHDFWGAAYAQAYRNQLTGVTLVDHNANFRDIVAADKHLITLSDTFYLRPLTYWQNIFGDVYLDGYAPGIVEIRTTPRALRDGSPDFQVNEAVGVAHFEVKPEENGRYLVEVIWQTTANPEKDYSVAVHLVANEVPAGPEDIIDQADSRHPIEGWYPTSGWQAGQVVQDVYQLQAGSGTTPVAIRLTMYHVDETGQFINGEWLTIPLEN